MEISMKKLKVNYSDTSNREFPPVLLKKTGINQSLSYAVRINPPNCLLIPIDPISVNGPTE